MRIAVWNTPPAAFMASGFDERVVHITRAAPDECLKLLHTGEVDVALLSPLMIFSDPSLYDVVPGVALSAWDYPYAKLVLNHDLGTPIQTLAVDPQAAQEVLTARVILKEHYGATPDVVSYEGNTDELVNATEDAFLLVGPEVATMQPEGAYVMDLSQEWYELSNYPMVWGLFATRKDEAEDGLIRLMIDGIAQAEHRRPVWLSMQDTTPEIYDFFRNNIRVRLDDLAQASLTEWRQYLFYYGVTPDVADLPLASLPEDIEEEGETPSV